VEFFSPLLFDGIAGSILWTLLSILLGGVIGGILALRHLRFLRTREAGMEGFLTMTCDKVRPQKAVRSSALVTGSAVFTVDYFQKIVTLFFMLVGGRVRAYEYLLRRARTEAFLRMRDSAKAAEADCVINVRFETSTISLLGHIGGIEVLAYGTLLVFDGGTDRATSFPRGASTS
jgi:uncharacterized protein YbjQ (UPF0145 family)